MNVRIINKILFPVINLQARVDFPAAAKPRHLGEKKKKEHDEGTNPWIRHDIVDVSSRCEKRGYNEICHGNIFSNREHNGSFRGENQIQLRVDRVSREILQKDRLREDASRLSIVQTCRNMQ